MSEDRKDSKAFNGTNIESVAQRLRDVLDLQDEAAERENGRAKRFFSGDRIDGPSAEKRKEKERRFDALLRLLQDPHYARLYFEAADTVRRAAEAAEKVMRRLAHESAIATHRLDDLRESAAKLPDGRAVFESASDGRLYAEDGTDVTTLRHSAIGLTKNSPSWKSYGEAKAAADGIERQIGEVEAYRQNVIDPANERIDNAEGLPADELKAIIERTNSEMPSSVRDALETAKISGPDPGVPSDTEADRILGSTPLNAPDVSGAFKNVRDDAYASSSATALPTTGPKP